MDCIFCKIKNNEAPSAKVYEDDKVLAFLDINPVNFGHTLVIPKDHYHWMTDTPDELLAEVFKVSKKVMLALKVAVNADFVVVSVVGLDVPHFHVQLIPRYFNDNLSGWPTKKYIAGEMGEVAEKIKKQINN